MGGGSHLKFIGQRKWFNGKDLGPFEIQPEI